MAYLPANILRWRLHENENSGLGREGRPLTQTGTGTDTFNAKKYVLTFIPSYILY